MNEIPPLVAAAPARHWLDRERLRLYSAFTLALCFSLTIFLATYGRNDKDARSLALGQDFVTFWAASRLAADGKALAAYDPVAIATAERAALPGLKSTPSWQYPPSFLLIVLPLSLLPFLWSFGLFIGSSLLAYAAVIRRSFAAPGSLLPLLGFSGLWLNLLEGQNAFLTAGLIGAGLLVLETRPWLAGLCFGLLTIKPHLALLLPVALIFGGHWRTLASMAATALSLLALSLVAFGWPVLIAFLDRLPQVAAWTAANAMPVEKMPSVFVFAHLLGLPITLAYGLQAAVALTVAGVTGWLWRRDSAPELRYAALVTGSLLISPYLFDYDLAWLALALAWFTRYALREGWRRGEREVLVMAWLLPVLVPIAGNLLPLQLGPIGLLALLFVIVRRTASGRTCDSLPSA